jgi:hypothetical protein
MSYLFAPYFMFFVNLFYWTGALAYVGLRDETQPSSAFSVTLVFSDRPSRIKSDRLSHQIPNTAMIVRVAIARSRIKSDRPSHQIPNTAMILPTAMLE